MGEASEGGETGVTSKIGVEATTEVHMTTAVGTIGGRTIIEGNTTTGDNMMEDMTVTITEDTMIAAALLKIDEATTTTTPTTLTKTAQTLSTPTIRAIIPTGMTNTETGAMWVMISIPPYTREMGITAGMSAMAEMTWMRDEAGRRASNPRPSETNLKVLLRLRLRLPH